MNNDFDRQEAFGDMGDDSNLQETHSLEDLLRDVKAHLQENREQEFFYDSVANDNP